MSRPFTLVAFVFLFLSAVGFLDATYLTVEHYRGITPPCSFRGCETVLASRYNEFFGVPVALFGALYYLTLIILSIAYLDSNKISLLKYASYCTPAGLLASGYFVYLQLFVIHAICQYCMLSAGTSTLLFIAGMYVLKKN